MIKLPPSGELSALSRSNPENAWLWGKALSLAWNWPPHLANGPAEPSPGLRPKADPLGLSSRDPGPQEPQAGQAPTKSALF